jgi:hypothetical protein
VCITAATAIIDESRNKPHDFSLPMWESMSDQQMLDLIPRRATVARQVQSDLSSWVQELRRRGATWSRIGQALGITRQSAWERFSSNE